MASTGWHTQRKFATFRPAMARAIHAGLPPLAASGTIAARDAKPKETRMPDSRPPLTNPAPLELTSQEKVFTLAGIMLGLLLGALDQTIVSTAGPAIQHDLAIPASLYAWITTSYLVASTVLVPIYGKVSDLIGRKPVLLFGIVVFLGGSLLCGVSQTTVQLILARAVQGMGSASLFTSAFAVIADMFPPAERGRYNGLIGSVFALSSVIGPLAGGFITDHFGWHWVFFINLPLGALAIGFIALKMPRLGRPTWHDPDRPRVDIAGAGALVLCVVPLLTALSLGRTELARAGSGNGWLWTSPQILGLLGTAILGLVAFLRIEARAHDPILDLRLFRNPVFAWGNLATFISGASFLSGIVFLPLFMVNVIGLSATRSGLTITPLTFGIVAGNVLSGHLVSRIGKYRPLLLAGLTILMVAFAIMGFTLSPESTQAEVTIKMVLVGLGLGPAIPLYTLAIQNSVQPRQMGVATSSATFFRQMGSTMGVAILGTVFASALASGIHARVAAALEGVPADVRAQLPMGTGPAAGGEGSQASRGHFDAQTVRAQVNAHFDTRRAQLIRTGFPPQALVGLDTARSQALRTVDQVALAIKQAFTSAISEIYRIGLLIGALGFLVTLRLPEVPLRKTMHAAPPPAD
jgi:EmrB/QacA subfamily drug resistance transporter